MARNGRKIGSCALVLAAAVAGAAAPAPARAFELFGVRLWGEKTPTSDRPDPQNPEAQTYTLDLQAVAPDPALRETVTEIVRNASRLWDGRTAKPPASPSAFLSILRGETERIVAALRGEAFYAVAVKITVDGEPLESLTPDTVLARPAAVRMMVDGGAPFTFGKVVVVGRPPDPPDVELSPRRDTPEKLGLVPGLPAKAAVIPAAEQAMLAGWRRQGRALPTTAPRTLIARHDTRTLDVTVAAEPGPETFFGPVTVAGTERTDPAFVAEYADLPPADASVKTRWDQAKVERAERRLRDLQVFSSARVAASGPPKADGTLPLTIQTAERPLRAFAFDASHSTLDGLGVGGSWLHRNLFGRAERLKLEARVNGVRSADPRDFTYLVGGTLTQPGVFGPTVGLTTQAFLKREAPETYIQTGAFLRSGVVWEASPTLTVSAMAAAEFDDVDDAFGKRKLAFFSAPLELAYDGANDKLAPTDGVRAKLALEPFVETRYGEIGAVVKASAADYLALGGDRRYVLATRLTVGGTLGETAADRLPPDRLFFAGGGQSVRGYAYRSLGPKLASGETVGGRSALEGSLELRAKVTESIGVVPFVDAGAAYDSAFPDFSRPLKVGAGLGVRYYTGLGPLRADVAVPVGDGGLALYLGLGESF